MNTEKGKKLNQLLSQSPRGIVYTQKYLSQLGYYHDLVKSYKRSGWLQSIGPGAYILPNDRIDFYSGIYAVQQQLKLPVHVGGRTALELKGYGHYGQTGKPVCFLFGKQGVRLPKWFRQYNWGVEINFKSTNLFPQNLPDSFSEYSIREITLNISAPERAAMEMLYYVPTVQGFDEALLIMGGLLTLRPELIQKLLQKCQQIKVKRLFLYMASKLQLPWLAELNLNQINLGSGKRVVVADGILDYQYQITVPREDVS